LIPGQERLAAALGDRYRLERELGQGGMATVYLAYDLKHDRQVAIKVLRPELAAVIGADRFLSEIKTTANLQHPHILPLFDSGAAQGVLYYVMPFVEGESLRDRLQREKQLPIADGVRIATEVADALEYAHRRGIVHRDIKPENILLHEGRALVADFGIALAASKAGDSRMTQTGMSLGTPSYMSPEQAMGEREIGPRSDVYALGATTYEMFTGEPPFTGPTAQSIVAKVMTERPAAPSSRRDTLPPGVDAAVMTALQKLPADRWGTAKEFAEALRNGGQAAARPGVESTRPMTAAGRPGGPVLAPRRGLIAILGALSVTSALSAVFFATRPRPTGPSVFDAALPDSAPMTFAAPSATAYGTQLRNLSVSDQGDFVVYVAGQGDSTMLWYRSLRDATSRPVTGTSGGTTPRISPDGRSVAYIGARQILLVPTTGGTARSLIDVISPTSLEWLSPTELLAGHQDGGRLSWIDPGVGQTRARDIPRCVFGRWVPEQRALTCAFNETAIVVDPATDTVATIRTALPDGSAGAPITGSGFRVIEGTYLIYLSLSGELRAAPYDAKRHLVGRSVILTAGVRREALGDGQFDVSSSGMLAYAPGANAQMGRLVRLTRGRAPEALSMEAGTYQRFDVSHDGRWLAAVVQTVDGQELRIVDLRDGQRTTWLKAEAIRHPLWSPTGDRLILGVRDGTASFVLTGSPGSGRAPDTLVKSPTSAPLLYDPIDFASEGNVLVQNWAGFVVLRMSSTSPQRLDTVLTDARFPAVSPGGRHIAYLSRPGEIVVTSYPTPGRRWQVAANGVEPLWLSATELVYRSGVSWYVSRIDPATGEPLGPPTLWARDPRFSDTSGWSNRPSRDGGIIYVQGPSQTGSAYLRAEPGWVAKMKAAVDQANR
jgi:serine/threonine-protein kinase